MKTCKIVFPRVLQTEERPDNISSPEQAKVKITSALLTAVEYAAYRGDEDLKYPLVPGRFAVGIVVEAGENCCAVEKGTRVYLNGVYACGQDAEEKLCVAGADCDGFLRDFIVTDEEKLSPLPAAVSDKEAVFTEAVALCEAVADKIEADKGRHIAVIGATALGMILCQLLIYHQAVPVLIDSDPEKLKKANRAGIYYTLAADETLQSNLSQITGGRMAYGGVLMTESKLSPELLFSVTGSHKNVVFAGFTDPDHKISVKQAFRKNLNVFSVNNGYSYTSAAINLLVNKAVNISALECPSVQATDIEQALAAGAKDLDDGKYPACTLLNMM